MPNRDDKNDPKNNNRRNEGNPRRASDNQKDGSRNRRRADKLRSDRAKYRSDEATIREQRDFYAELVKIGDRMLREAYAQSYTLWKGGDWALTHVGLKDSSAKGRRASRLVDQELIAYFRKMADDELALQSPDWAVVRDAHFGLASVYLKGRDLGSAEFSLLECLRLVQKHHGEHSRPSITFAARAYHWLFKHAMFGGALRFAEKLHCMLQGHLSPEDPRLAPIWLHIAQCYSLTKNAKKAIVAALESWNATLRREGRAPRLFPLLCVARMHLARGDFSRCAEAAGLIVRIAEAYRMTGTEHHLDAQALLSEVTLTT